MGWHLATALPDPRSLRSDCPPWLAELVARLAAKSPGDRPENASAAIALLEARRRAPTTAPSPRPAAPQAPGTVELSPETLRAALQEVALSAGSPSGTVPSAPSTVVLDAAAVAATPPADGSARPATPPPAETPSPLPVSPSPESPAEASQPDPSRRPPASSGLRLLAALGMALGILFLGGQHAQLYGDPLILGLFLCLPVMAIGLVALPSTEAPRRRGLALLCGLVALWSLLGLLHSLMGLFHRLAPLDSLLIQLGFLVPSF